MEPGEIAGLVIGAVVGILGLYFIIRLAVRHGIQDVRAFDAAARPDAGQSEGAGGT